MSFEWQPVKLSELIEIKHGFAFKGEYFTDEVTPYQLTTPGNFSVGGGFQAGKPKYYRGPIPNEYVLSAGDLLVTMTDLSKAADTLGYAAELPASSEITWLHNQRVGLVSIKDSSRISKDFLHYLMRSHDYRHWVVSTATGSTVKHTSPSRICDYKFLLPPISYQKSASSIFKFIEKRITLLRETNTTLEAIAQALFKSWFVDFDPVHAKQQGRAPEGMDAQTAALFPDSFEESELGMVPKGWRLLPFGECLTHTIGGDWGSDAPEGANDTRVAIIRGTDIPDLQACGESRVPIRFTSQKKLKNRELKVGDIVIEVSGGSKDQPTGRSILMTPEILSRFDCPVEPASFCRLFRPSEMGLSYLLAQHLVYIYAQGKTWEYQNQSTGIANFQTTHFLETELVAVPADDVLKKFCEIVEPMVKQMYSSQIQQLAELRDTLLPRLISGQLRLPEAQALVEDTVDA